VGGRCEQDFITKITNYVVRKNSVSLEALQRARLLVLDNLGCILGALDFVPSIPFLNAYRISPLAPYFLNPLLLGSLGNLLDFDDTILSQDPPLTGHPGSAIIPAALAAAIHADVDAKTFFEAVAVGYEVGIRMGLISSPAEGNIRGMGSWMVFGACSAAARILLNTKPEVSRALSLAGKFAPLPTLSKFADYSRGEVDWIKNNLGWVSLGGFLAAYLTANGLKGPAHFFEEPNGFFQMVCSTIDISSEKIKDLEAYAFIRDVALKPYPCCRFIHSSLDALNQTIEKQRVNMTTSINQIDVETASDFAATSLSNYPSTEIDAQFSIPYTLAASLILGPWYAGWLKKESIKRKDIISLAQRVVVKKWEKKHPFLAARVTVYYTNGSQVQASVENPIGEPSNPLPLDLVRDKFLRLSHSRLGEMSDALSHEVLCCPDDAPVREILRPSFFQCV
jgi:2-methylcitrate dehydratase PrpD